MNNQREIEFIVESVKAHSNHILITGRCAKAKIRVGDYFSSTYSYLPVTKLEDYAQPAERTAERAVSLRVEAICSYGVPLDEIDSGLTAELTLSGSCEKTLNVADVLGGSSYEVVSQET